MSGSRPLAGTWFAFAVWRVAALAATAPNAAACHHSSRSSFVDTRPRLLTLEACYCGNLLVMSHAQFLP
jgi:hypothetical protein